jgi:hypothetical protein
MYHTLGSLVLKWYDGRSNFTHMGVGDLRGKGRYILLAPWPEHCFAVFPCQNLTFQTSLEQELDCESVYQDIKSAR